MVSSVTIIGTDDKCWVAEITIGGTLKASCYLDASDRACGTVAERLVDRVLAGEPLMRQERTLRLHKPE